MGDIVQIDPSEPPIYCPEEETCAAGDGCPEGTKPGNTIPSEFVGGGVIAGCRNGKPVDKLYSLGDNGIRYNTYSDGGTLCADCQGGEFARTQGSCINNNPQYDIELSKKCDPSTEPYTQVLLEFCWIDGVKQQVNYINCTTGLEWVGDPTTLVDCPRDWEYKWFEICIDGTTAGWVCIEIINGIQGDPFMFKDDKLVTIPEPANWVSGKCNKCNPKIASMTAADLSTAFAFTKIDIIKPKCCTVTVKTTAGVVVLGPEINVWSTEFKCPVELVEVSTDCEPIETKIILQLD